MKLLALFVFFSLSFSNLALARNAFVDSLNKKVDVKKQSRWTLADWLGTKKKVDMMDSWLALNSSSNIFEFYLEASLFDYENMNPHAFSAAGFISIFGVKLEQKIFRQEISSSAEGILRLLGKSEQGTRLNLFYGLRVMDESIYSKIYEMPYWGGEIRLYLLSFLSMDGRYLNYSKSERSDSLNISGYDLAFGVNIDIGPIQFFFQKLNEVRSVTGQESSHEEGFRYGLRLYF